MKPTPSAQLSKLLSRFPPEIVALAKRTLPKLRRAFPGTYELVYDYAGSLVVSFSPTEQGYEGIVALSIDPRRVRLYFDKSLADPKGLLEGAGSKVRSVTLEAASQLDRGDVHELVAAAIEHSGVTFTRTVATRMIFKSEAKKSKPTKSKKAMKKSPKK
ncbi:MAG TPA: hypothetical protein VFV19_15905 [Candidatus Polarisedimenticolaceae bacterium]|nr:hypothetical protein [Candidatus Polarisedimenticolaceae bacterium]